MNADSTGKGVMSILHAMWSQEIKNLIVEGERYKNVSTIDRGMED